MISPLAQTLLSLLGLAAAGIPLLYFTAPPPGAEPAPHPASAPAAASAAVPATLRCSGQVLRVRLWQQGQLLCELSPRGGYWQGELELSPAPCIEIEAEATWAPSPAAGAEALSIELSPPGLPTRQDTQWAQPPAAHQLHTIFTFTWP